jgi:protease-4
VAAGLAVAGALLVAPVVNKKMHGEASKLRHSLDFGPQRVAVLPLNGEIVSAEDTVRWLRHFGEDVNGVKAIVIAEDTPGGGVAPSQEIYQEISRLRKDDGIKVVAAMGNMAASGGYYVASACDEIVADPGTVTGSIGVIMDSFQVEKLLEKVGAKSVVIKSGEFKDAGSPFREMTPRERSLFQATIDDVYDQFVDDVAVGRHDALAEAMARRSGRKADAYKDSEIKAYVKSLADGRIYTGRQAYDLGLVDTLGGLQDAIEEAGNLANLKDPQVVTMREQKSFAEMMTGMNRNAWGAFLRETLMGSAPRLSYLLR